MSKRRSAAKSKPGTGASSSGHPTPMTSRASSPSSAKSLVGTYRLDGLPVLWDNLPEARDRVRSKQNLLRSIDPVSKEETDNWVEGTTQNVILNAFVLEPICSMMKEHNLALPSIENLIWAFESFYSVSKVSVNGELCYQHAWGIRRLLGKLKCYAYKDRAPEDRARFMHGPMFLPQAVRQHIYIEKTYMRMLPRLFLKTYFITDPL